MIWFKKLVLGDRILIVTQITSFPSGVFTGIFRKICGFKKKFVATFIHLKHCMWDIPVGCTAKFLNKEGSKEVVRKKKFTVLIRKKSVSTPALKCGPNVLGNTKQLVFIAPSCWEREMVWLTFSAFSGRHWDPYSCESEEDEASGELCVLCQTTELVPHTAAGKSLLYPELNMTPWVSLNTWHGLKGLCLGRHSPLPGYCQARGLPRIFWLCFPWVHNLINTCTCAFPDLFPQSLPQVNLNTF